MSVWLCQIAKHLWYKEYKKLNQHSLESIDDFSDIIPSGDNVEKRILENDSKIELYQKIHN